MAIHAQRFDSRQSMRNASFEVFHYRDRQPGSVEVHHHDFYEIYFFLSGRVSFRVEGRTYTMEPGDLLLINPQELHQASIAPEALYERIVLWIDRGYLEDLGSEDADLTACFRPEVPNLLRPGKLQRAELRNLLDRLTQEYYSKDPGSSVYAKGLLLQFLAEVHRLTQSHAAPSGDNQDLISRVLAYIGEHYRESIRLEDLAGEFFVSKYYLSHAFTDRVGTSIYRYILFRRLLHSRELLSQGVSPGEAYQQCGFSDYANFYRAFKSEYGISPSVFARQ